MVHEFRKPLTIEEIDTPVPGSDQVVVAAHGDWPVKPTLPFVPGHEGVGIVTRVGV